VRPGHPAKLSPGHYVRLSVEDTGVGMDEATLERAVEPFFSTKGVGRGTGLGLSMVHGLASQLGGGLTIDSRPGAGTTVALWLPISAVAAEDDDGGPGDAPPRRGARHGAVGRRRGSRAPEHGRHAGRPRLRGGGGGLGGGGVAPGRRRARAGPPRHRPSDARPEREELARELRARPARRCPS
jgi:hypothetical protein